MFSGLTPHGFCLLWNPGLIWLHAGSDLVIATAYFSIPLALAAFARVRRDIEYRWVLLLFAAFIMACGATHLISIITLWIPAYYLEGVIKMVTAALSLATAVMLWPLLPQLLALPSPRALQKINQRLQEQETQASELNRALELAEHMAHVGHWRMALPDLRMTWSDELLLIHGVEREGQSLDLKTALASYQVDDSCSLMDFIDQAVSSGKGFECSARLTRPSGECRHVLWRGVTQTTNEHIQAVFGVIIDLTEQVVAREALKRARDHAKAANRALKILASEDSLTTLANRRRFDDLLGREFSRAFRSRRPVGLIILDVDCFKQYNDTYGHYAGDICLRMIADEMKRCAKRAGDTVARLGGEELAVLMADTDEDGALTLAESIVSAIRDLAIPHTLNKGGVVTISAGVCALAPVRGLHTTEQLYKGADHGLYCAKSTGRDRVVLHRVSEARALVGAEPLPANGLVYS